MLPPFLPFDEPNLCIDSIFMNSEYNDGSSFLNQVDSDTDLLDNVIFIPGCYTTNQKTKEYRPTQIKIEDNSVQKEIVYEKQETQECKYPTT